MKHNVLLLALLCTIAAPLAHAEAPPPPRMVTVVGEASEEVLPDQAILSGQIISRSKDIGTAKQETERLLKRTLSVAAQFDIPKDKIAASNVSVSPEYQYTNNKQQLAGYIVSRHLSITMDKMEVHEELLSKLIDSGITQISGISFLVSKEKERADALRIKAFQNAKLRAQALAGAAGANLGKVVNIAMDGTSPPIMAPWHRSMAMPLAAAPAAVASVGEGASPSLPGLTRLQANVSVTFELE